MRQARSRSSTSSRVNSSSAWVTVPTSVTIGTAAHTHTRAAATAGWYPCGSIRGELVGVLIDHGVVPGDLRGAFEPWSGSRQERVAQVRREMIAMDGMPWPGQIAWFFRENNPPAGTPR